MSCDEARWPGFWNSVNSASSSRTMMTQRAKLRRLAFIPRRLSCPERQGAADGRRRVLQAVIHDSFTNVGPRLPPAKGTGRRKSPANPAHSNPFGHRLPKLAREQLCVWLRPISRRARARRAGARSTVRRSPRAGDDGARQGASKPRGVWRSRQIRRAALRACRVRPALRCRPRRWRGRAGAAQSRPAIVQTARPGTRSVRASARAAAQASATASSTAASSAASARRARRASSASRSAFSPSRSSAGIAVAEPRRG